MTSHNNMNTDYWEKRRNRVFSNKGGWQIGIGVHNSGYDMMKDLAGKKNYFQVLTLNCTGRLPSEELGKWLGSFFICMSWPDPRIWCNTIGALAGSLQARVCSGVTAGLLSSDSRMFGSGEIIFSICSFMESALKQKQSGLSVPELISKELEERSQIMKKPVIPGFARPLATGDERVTAMSAYARELGFQVGEHENLAMEINNYLMEKQNESMNIGGYLAAFMADQGFSAKENMRIYTTVVNSGIHACHVEEQDNPPLSFMPTSCADIEYKGRGKRSID